jgi:hypothetical protein
LGGLDGARGGAWRATLEVLQATTKTPCFIFLFFLKQKKIKFVVLYILIYFLLRVTRVVFLLD